MEKKVLLADIADALAKKAGITKKNADAFVRAFFSTIEQNLLEDNYVKVKNFGTFKIIRVNERESVNVATGERIQISSHGKVSFTPEGALRDQVNLPFAHFTNVELNDDTTLEELEEIETPTEKTEDVVEEPTPAVEEAQPAAEEPAPVVEEPTPAAEEPTPAVEEPAPAVEEPAPAVESIQQGEPQEETSEETISTNTDFNDDDIMEQPTNWWKVACISIIVVILMILSYLAGYHRIFTSTTTENSTPVENTTETTDSISLTPTLAAPDSTATSAAAPEETPTNKYQQLPGGKYEIVGIQDEVTFRPGMTITKLARKYYSDTDLAEYIVFHNHISDPNIVEVNAKIQIPELRARN